MTDFSTGFGGGTLVGIAQHEHHATSDAKKVLLFGFDGANYNIVNVDASGVIASGVSTVTAATLANVSASASSVTLFASNSAARGRMVFNDSSVSMYLKFGSAASTTSFTVKIRAAGYYEFPQPVFTGLVAAIWDSATGAARTTEV